MNLNKFEKVLKEKEKVELTQETKSTDCRHTNSFYPEWKTHLRFSSSLLRYCSLQFDWIFTFNISPHPYVLFMEIVGWNCFKSAGLKNFEIINIVLKVHLCKEKNSPSVSENTLCNTGSSKKSVTFYFLIWKGYINCYSTKLVWKFGYIYDILKLVFQT